MASPGPFALCQEYIMTNDLRSLRKGAVVSCFFPLTEAPGKPGPTARPALVVQVFFDRTDDTWKVVVAYGTSRRTRANTGYEIRVNKQEGLEKAGLHLPTRFTLSRMRILPFDETFFAFSPEGTPVLGHLDEGLMQRLDRTCEILAEYAAPLKPLARHNGANFNVEPDLPADYGTCDVPAWESRKMDLFMRDCMTGRARFNGPRKVG